MSERVIVVQSRGTLVKVLESWEAYDVWLGKTHWDEDDLTTKSARVTELEDI